MILPDCSGNYRELGAIDQLIQVVQEAVTLRPALEEMERSRLPSDLALVQNHDIMAKLLEFESLQTGYHELNVVVLSEDAEVQYEHLIIRVDRGETVVAALVDVEHVVAVRHVEAEVGLASDSGGVLKALSMGNHRTQVVKFHQEFNPGRRAAPPARAANGSEHERAERDPTRRIRHSDLW